MYALHVELTKIIHLFIYSIGRKEETQVVRLAHDGQGQIDLI
jgi:hypothetical protein